MPRNIELKARVKDPAGMSRRVATLTAYEGITIAQEDVFYRTGFGRLKLRVSRPGEAELIYYSRDETSTPFESHYLRVPIADPVTLNHALSAALGILSTVKKLRVLHFLGTTRIHLDSVEGLGDFIELEYVLKDGEPEENGYRTIQQISKELEIEEHDLVNSSYLDLL